MDDLETAAAAAAEEEVVSTEQVTEAPEAEHTPEQVEEKTRSQKRREERKAELDRLRASEADANARLAAETARLERLKSAAAALPEPKEADFEKYEDYLAARTAYASVKALDGRTEAEIQAEIEARRRDVAAVKERQAAADRANWTQQVAEAKGRYSDFDQVVYSQDVPISERMAQAIMSTDTPADVAYRIASDRELAREISAMSDRDMWRAIGRIEATLSAPRPKTTTTAPAPINPVRPQAAAVSDPTKMTATEYAEWRAKGGTFTL